MPPRAPALDVPPEMEDVAMTPATPTKSFPTEPARKKTRNTFHWELNLYSFVALTLIYMAVPKMYQWIMHTVFALIAVDASRYYYAKGRIAGVPYTLPFVSLLAMIIHPSRFWAEMANIAMESPDGMCFNTLVGCFLVFCTDPPTCREILTSERQYSVYAHPNALWLFGPKNLIYLEGDRHKRFRAILTPALFSHEALTAYSQAQEQVVRRFMDRYAKECAETRKPLNLMFAFRSMAAASSQEAFLGPYLNDELRESLEQDILTVRTLFIMYYRFSILVPLTRFLLLLFSSISLL
jgi:hypothetical protein